MPRSRDFETLSDWSRPTANPVRRVRADPVTSRVTLAFTVTPRGEPTAVRVVESSGDKGLDQITVAAFQQRRPKPAIVNGVAVKSERTWVVSSRRRL